MIVDSSALMAIVNDEPGAQELLRAAAEATCQMSVATWLEVSIVADNRSAAHGERLDKIVEALEIEIIPVSTRHGVVARHAHRRFGRGSGSGSSPCVSLLRQRSRTVSVTPEGYAQRPRPCPGIGTRNAAVAVCSWRALLLEGVTSGEWSPRRC